MLKRAFLIYFIILLIIFQQAAFEAHAEPKEDIILNEEQEPIAPTEPDEQEESETQSVELVEEIEKEIPADDELDIETQEGKPNEAATQSSMAPLVLGVGIFTKTSLTAEGNKELIELVYEGSGLSLGLGSIPYYTYFKLPEEIATMIENGEAEVSASYELSGISDDFLNKDIGIDPENHQVYTKYSILISLTLSYKVTLTIKLGELPPREDGLYKFYSQTRKSLVDVSILGAENVAYAELALPPTINEPIYPSTTLVTGKGKSDRDIRLTIDNEEYTGRTDGDGKFAIEINQQAAGTVISRVLINDEGDEISKKVEVTVQQGTLSFDVPDTLSFESIPIKSGIVRIPLEDPNWAIQVNDTRGEESTWQLFAQMIEPFKSKESEHELEDALIIVNNQSLADNVKIFDGVTGLDTNTSVELKPSLKLNPINAYAENYSANITWTLTDAP